MKLISLTSLALSVTALFISGCAVSGNNNVQVQNVTGNWQLGPIDDFFHNEKLGNLSGSLSGQGKKVTGVLHASGGCVAPAQDIAFSGTEDATGKLTLTSTDLPGNIATLAGTVSSASGGVSIQGSLTVTGSGPCATPPYKGFMGTQYSPLSGSYSANLTSTGGATATLTANINAAAANADGEVPETGTVTLTTSACSTSFSFNGTAIGATLDGTLASGSTNATLTGVLMGGTSPGATVTIVNPEGTCAAGSFTGTILPQ